MDTNFFILISFLVFSYIFYKNLNHQLNQETKHNPDVALKMACLYLQNRAGIWKSRVSTQPSSLADQLGLIGTLYNPEFNAGNAGMEVSGGDAA